MGIFFFYIFTFPLIKACTKNYFWTPTYLAKYMKLKYITALKSVETGLKVIHVFAKYVLVSYLYERNCNLQVNVWGYLLKYIIISYEYACLQCTP